jgi:acyl-CoA thioester hydrolase
MNGYNETYRKAVTADMCDMYGHMNVQFYVAAISDSFFSLMTAVGLGKSAVQDHRIGLVAVNMNIDYLSEVEAGDVIYMQGAIVSANGKKLTCNWKLYDQATEKQAMEATVLYVCMDLDKRCSRDIPKHLLESAQNMQAQEVN